MNITELRQAWEILQRLEKIAYQLHHQDENACNFGLTPRQQTKVKNLEEDAEILAQELGLHAYHQGDPRGATLYLIESLEKAEINYYSGLCIA